MPQLCSTVSDELLEEISELAKRESRSPSNMASVLLAQAMKERLRVREKSKKKKVEENG